MHAGAGEPAVRPVLNVVGERVALGPLSRTLLPRYQAWLNDVATQAWAGFPVRPEPWTDEQMAHWYDRAATDHERMFFTIYETDAWRAVGFCVLRDIDPSHRTAEFGMTIGDRTDRGKGYGTEAVRLLLDLAFTGLGLQNVQLQTYEFNHAALRAYERAGFKEYGRRRRCHFMGGRFWDVVYMDYLAEEFCSPVLSRVLTPDEAR
jgi:diamine N-acetyltransferase